MNPVWNTGVPPSFQSYQALSSALRKSLESEKFQLVRNFSRVKPLCFFVISCSALKTLLALNWDVRPVRLHVMWNANQMLLHGKKLFLHRFHQRFYGFICQEGSGARSSWYIYMFCLYYVLWHISLLWRPFEQSFLIHLLVFRTWFGEIGFLTVFKVLCGTSLSSVSLS